MHGPGGLKHAGTLACAQKPRPCTQLPASSPMLCLQGLAYAETSGDEVEDLYRLLAHAKAELPELQAVASGAIASDYQRLRVENVRRVPCNMRCTVSCRLAGSLEAHAWGRLHSSGMHIRRPATTLAVPQQCPEGAGCGRRCAHGWG